MSESISQISQRDYDVAMLYDAMMDRHCKAPDAWGIAMMSARLYCKRVGLDRFLHEVINEGVQRVAAKCRAEMMVRHEFFVRMLHDHPPDDAADIEEAAEELAIDLATFDRPDTTMRLLKFLDRLLRRERALHLGASKTTH